MAQLAILINGPESMESLHRNPITDFAHRRLILDYNGDVSCGEPWVSYSGIAATGELPKLEKSKFFRRLPTVMRLVHKVRKSHNILREGRRVRGFRGVNLIEYNWGNTAAEPETLPEPNLDS